MPGKRGMKSENSALFEIIRQYRENFLPELLEAAGKVESISFLRKEIERLLKDVGDFAQHPADSPDEPLEERKPVDELKDILGCYRLGLTALQTALADLHEEHEKYRLRNKLLMEEMLVDSGGGESLGRSLSGTSRASHPPSTGEEKGLVPFAEKEALEEEIKQKEEALRELHGRYDRLRADFENFRRRTRDQQEEMKQTASEQIITRILPILDNFDRALTSTGTVEAVLEGVLLIRKQLEDLLAKEGVSPIFSVGKLFDPSLHEALLHVETEDHQEERVVEELRKGYKLGEKVLRPSLVKVEKGKMANPPHPVKGDMENG